MLTNLLSQFSQRILATDTCSSVNVTDDLAKSVVCKIVEDPGGRLWLVTPNGLSRYDANGLKNYRHDPLQTGSISSDCVTCILCDSKGILWVGTSNGLNKYNSLTDTFTLIVNDPHDLNSLSDNSVRVLTEDKLGNLWIGTENGLNLIHSRRDKKTLTRFLSSDISNKNAKVIIHDLHVDSAGTVWVATSNGLAKVHGRSLRVEKLGNEYQKSHKKNTELQFPDWKSLIKHHESVDKSDIAFIRNVIRIIEDRISDRTFTIPELTTLIGMSQSVLYKKIRRIHNTTVNDFIKTVRLNKAAELLQQEELSVYEISLMVGFEDRKYFSREFKKQFGVNPKNWHHR